jgi:CheY-like chemotaxis protein
LEKVTAEDFDLIICDVRMPGMGGLEMIERARDHFLQNGKPHPPEILISGYGSKENFEKARALRIAAYLDKPFDVTEFLSEVSMALLPSPREGANPLLGTPGMDEKAPIERPVFGFKTSGNML